MTSVIPEDYFLETTLSHLMPHQGLQERYRCRAIDVTLTAKLTLTYGKYHLAMLHRQLAMSEEQTTYQQAEQQAAMMRSTIVASLAKNQMTIFHSSPADFLRPFFNFASDLRSSVCTRRRRAQMFEAL